MKLKKIHVLGTTFKIKETEDYNILSENLWGTVDFAKSIIHIRKSLDPQCKYETLWHEIVHTIENKMGITLADEDTDRIAQGIAYILRHNKMKEKDVV